MSRDSDLEKLRKKQVDILLSLDRIIRQNDLTYCLAQDAVLGAYLRQGFLPWSRELSVYLSCRDFEQLSGLSGRLPDGLLLQTFRSDPEFGFAWARLVDPETSCFYRKYVGLSMAHGVAVNLLIYYPFPSGYHRSRKMIRTFRELETLLSGEPSGSGIARLKEHVTLLRFSENERKSRIEAVLHAFRDYNRYHEPPADVSTYLREDSAFRGVTSYPEKWFAYPHFLEFEGALFPCPADPEGYLARRYGPGFRKFADHPAGSEETEEIVYGSVSEPYRKFKGVYY